MRFYNFIATKMKFEEETIFNYLDGTLEEKDRIEFEEVIQNNLSLRQEYEHYKAIHEAMLAEPIRSPGNDFAERVMASITTLELRTARFFNKGRLFVLGLVTLILLSSIYFLGVQFYPAIGDMLGNEVSLKQFTLNLNPAQRVLDSGVLFKVVFYTNGVIGLLLLDRALLKPYFERRRERYSI